MTIESRDNFLMRYPAIAVCLFFCFAHSCGKLFHVKQVAVQNFGGERFSRALAGRSKSAQTVSQIRGEFNQHTS